MSPPPLPPIARCCRLVVHDCTARPAGRRTDDDDGGEKTCWRRSARAACDDRPRACSQQTPDQRPAAAARGATPTGRVDEHVPCFSSTVCSPPPHARLSHCAHAKLAEAHTSHTQKKRNCLGDELDDRPWAGKDIYIGSKLGRSDVCARE